MPYGKVGLFHSPLRLSGPLPLVRFRRHLAWHPDHIPDRVDKIFPHRELAERAAERRPHIVVITGGEPAIHDLNELTDCLRSRKLKVHLETSGAFPLRGTFDWVTVSPKEWKKPLLDCLVRADELKIVVDSLQAVDYWEKEISHVWCTDSIWLHPEWSKRNDRAILQMINRKVKEGKHPYRAGYQLHKIYEVDEEDTGARQGAPIRNGISPWRDGTKAQRHKGTKVKKAEG